MPSPLEVLVEQLTHSLDAPDEPSFAGILDALYRQKFDGAITLHCQRGVPRILEMGRVVRVDLTRAKPRPLTPDQS